VLGLWLGLVIAKNGIFNALQNINSWLQIIATNGNELTHPFLIRKFESLFFFVIFGN